MNTVVNSFNLKMKKLILEESLTQNSLDDQVYYCFKRALDKDQMEGIVKFIAERKFFQPFKKSFESKWFFDQRAWVFLKLENKQFSILHNNFFKSQQDNFYEKIWNEIFQVKGKIKDLLASVN